ncbi:MAG: DUF2284 domain-containing protein [Clostridia bacterium]|nr:DUF2284 domain-containing protein [Clostridia bacterium]
MNRDFLDAKLAELPLYQYAYIKTADLLFSDRVRWICEHECPMYGKTWACPPAVGSVEECKTRCLQYPDALLIATITEVNDIANIEETLSTRAPHEKITRSVVKLVAPMVEDYMVLSTEACAICDHCAYPSAPCRHPDRMYPCVESHGIIVTDLAEKTNIDFYAEGNLVTWFSLILYRETGKKGDKPEIISECT